MTDRAIVIAMLVALAVVVVVTMAREGFIHELAWADACHTLRTGGAIPGAWPEAIDRCNDLDPRRNR